MTNKLITIYSWLIIFLLAACETASQKVVGGTSASG